MWHFQLVVLLPTTSHQPVKPDTSLHSLESWGGVTTFLSRKKKRHRKTKEKKNTERWMDVILDLGISCTSTKNQQPAPRSTKGSTQAFTAPHGSHMAPEEARSEAGTCFPPWMTRRKQI